MSFSIQNILPNIALKVGIYLPRQLIIWKWAIQWLMKPPESKLTLPTLHFIGFCPQVLFIFL